jgi:hypothetical protein
MQMKVYINKGKKDELRGSLDKIDSSKEEFTNELKNIKIKLDLAIKKFDKEIDDIRVFIEKNNKLLGMIIKKMEYD